ncbi:MAG: hypothetical protein EP343_09900 [Deltaproteobacteria bacterium]|nr:MAG: hypothetical protein EP343_09900 [Deltaproteobacteria bacterium]
MSVSKLGSTRRIQSPSSLSSAQDTSSKKSKKKSSLQKSPGLTAKEDAHSIASQKAIQAKKDLLAQRAEKQELPSHRSTQSLMLSRKLHQAVVSTPPKTVSAATTGKGTATPPSFDSPTQKPGLSTLSSFRPLGDVGVTPEILNRSAQSVTNSARPRSGVQTTPGEDVSVSENKEPATVEEHHAALEEAQTDLRHAEAVLQHAPGDSSVYQQQIREAEQVVEERAQNLVVSQQEANQEAIDDDKPLPYPAATTLDASGSPREVSEQIARLPRDTQATLLGSPSHISQGEMVRLDAQRIRSAVAKGPEQGAQALQDTIGQEGLDPVYQQKVLEQSESSIEKLGASLNEAKDTDEAKRVIGTLSEVGEALGPDNTAILAKGIAANWPDGNLKKLDDGIEASILEGKGTTFAVQLANELYNVGKTDGAHDVSKAVTHSVGELTEDFQAAQEKVDKHNEQLAHLVGTQGELLPEDKLQQAIDAERGRNQKDFDDLEKKAALLASTVPGLGPVFDQDSAIAEHGEYNFYGSDADRLQIVGAAVAQEIPNLANSSSGSAVIGAMLERSGQGQSTALDHINDVAERTKDPDAFRGELSVALTESASSTLLAGGTQGTGQQTTSAHDGLLNQLENLKVLDPESPETAELRDTFDDLFRSGEPGKVEQFAERLLDVLNDGKTFANISPAFRDALKNRFKVHSLAFDSANVLFKTGQTLDNLGEDWRTGDALERSQLLVDVLDLGADGASAALKIADHAGRLSAASKAAWLGTKIDDVGGLANLKHVGKLPAVGVFVNGVTGIFEGAQAISDLKDGNYLNASIHGVSAAGAAVGAWSALSAAGVVGSIPGGQLVAAGLLVTGLGLNHYKNVSESNKYEGPTEQFLIDAGIDPDIAKQLSNHDNKGRSAGPVLAQLASRFGMSGPEFYDYLGSLSSGDVKKIVTHAHGVDPNDEGVFQLGDPNEIFMDGFNIGRSINGLANWLVENDLAPGAISNYSSYTGTDYLNDANA